MSPHGAMHKMKMALWERFIGNHVSHRMTVRIPAPTVLRANNCRINHPQIWVGVQTVGVCALSRLLLWRFAGLYLSRCWNRDEVGHSDEWSPRVGGISSQPKLLHLFLYSAFCHHWPRDAKCSFMSRLFVPYCAFIWLVNDLGCSHIVRGSHWWLPGFCLRPEPHQGELERVFVFYCRRCAGERINGGVSGYKKGYKKQNPSNFWVYETLDRIMWQLQLFDCCRKMLVWC